MYRGPLRIAANLADTPVEFPAEAPSAAEYAGSASVLLASDPDISLMSGRLTLPPTSFAVTEMR